MIPCPPPPNLCHWIVLLLGGDHSFQLFPAAVHRQTHQLHLLECWILLHTSEESASHGLLCSLHQDCFCSLLILWLTTVNAGISFRTFGTLTKCAVVPARGENYSLWEPGHWVAPCSMSCTCSQGIEPLCKWLPALCLHPTNSHCQLNVAKHLGCFGSPLCAASRVFFRWMGRTR